MKSISLVAILIFGLSIGSSCGQQFSGQQQPSQQQNGTVQADQATPAGVDPRALPYPSTFPAHDPHGRRQPQQQSVHLTFQPAPEQVPPGPNSQPSPTVYGDVSKVQGDQQNLIINPADIQFSVPDVPDSVSQKIIDQIRAQLGNKPVTIGELNNKFVSFTAELPGVLINRTLLTNVEEQTVVDENKITRTTYTAPTGTYSVSSSSYNPTKVVQSYVPLATPIKSYPYNPAAAAGTQSSYAREPKYEQGYSQSSYQYAVPSYTAYDTTYTKAKEYGQQSYQQPSTYQKPQESYQKPQESYQKPKEPYQKQELYQKQQVTYQKSQDLFQKPQESYQKPQESYQKPQESYQKPSYQQQSTYKQEEPKVIYKYIEVCSYPQQNNYQQAQSYSGGAQYQAQEQSQPQQYSQQQQYSSPQQKYESPTQQYESPYAVVAEGLAGAQYGTYGSDVTGATGEAQHSATDGYNKMAEVYAQIHDKMAQLQELQSYVRQMQDQASFGYGAGFQMPAMPSYGPIVVPSYPMGYQAIPMPSYVPSTPSYSSYSSPSTYSKPSSYQKPQQQTSYQQPKQQQTYSAPKTYESKPSYGTTQYPQDGNKVKVSYKKVEEKIHTNETKPAYNTKPSYGNGY